jgi:hypothetical protein
MLGGMIAITAPPMQLKFGDTLKPPVISKG